jgi:hypothetical protein
MLVRQDGTWSSSDLNFAPTKFEFYTQSINSDNNLEIPELIIKSNQIIVNSDSTSISASTGALKVIGGAGIGENLYVEGLGRFIDNTGSTSKDTGALVVDGGVGIEENLYIGGLTNISGSATIQGDLTVDGLTSFSGSSEFKVLYVSDHTYLGNNYETDILIVNATSTFNTDVAINGNVSINSPDTVTIDSINDITVDSSAGNISIGSDTVTGAINIGTSVSARTITVGNDASTKVDVNALAIELDSAGTIDIDAATSLSLNTIAGQAINVGNDAVTQTINIGNVAATAVNIDAIAVSIDSTDNSNITLTAADASDKTLTISSINAGAGKGLIDINADEEITIDSSAGAINIGSNTVTGAINIGDSASARTITIGNDASTKVDINALAIELDSAGTVDIDAATSLSLNTIAGQAINVGNDAVTQTINIGNVAATAVNIDAIALSLDSTDNSNITLTANDALTKTLTISSSNSGAGTGIIDITGSDNVYVDSSSGDINVGTDTDNGNINIGTSVSARTINIGNDASTKIDINALDIELDSAGPITVNGTGDINIQTQGGQTINIGTDENGQSLVLGNHNSVSTHLHGGYIHIDSKTNMILNLNTSSGIDTHLNLLSTNSGAGNGRIALNADIIDTHGIIYSFDTTQSTSKDNGSAVFEGGVGIEKNLFIGGYINIGETSSFDKDVIITGNLSVLGNQTVTNTLISVTNDPLLIIGNGSTTDILDIGFMGQYDSGSGARYAGLFRDATNSEFYLVNNIDHDPQSNNVISPFDNTNYANLNINSLLVEGTLDINGNIDADVTTYDVHATSTISIDSEDNVNLSMIANNASNKVLTISSSNSGVGSGKIDVNAQGGITIDSVAGEIDIGKDSNTGAINIGTGVSARTITVGNDASTKVDINALMIELDSVGAVDIDAGTSLSLNTIGGQTINIGNDAVAQTIVVGSSSATSITIDSIALSLDSSDNSNITLTANDVSDKTLTINSINSGAGKGLIDINADEEITIDSSAGDINIGSDAVTGAINVGVGASARTITVGNDASTKIDLNALAIELDSAGTVDIDATTSLSLNTLAGQAVNIGNDAVTQTINIGNAVATVVNIDAIALSLDSTDNSNISITTADGSDKTLTISSTNSGAGNGIIDIDSDQFNISSISTITNITDSISKDTGALIVEGGVGIERDLFVGGNVTINENLNVTGITTFIGDSDFNILNVNIALNSIGSTYIGSDNIDELIVNASSTFNELVNINKITEQLRLSYDIDSYTSLTVGSTSNLIITPAESGRILLKPTTDTNNFFSVQNVIGNNIINVDTSNDKVAIGTNGGAERTLSVTDSSGDAQFRITYDTGIYSEISVTSDNDLIINSQERTRIKPTNDSTGAFEVNTSANVNVFTVDTSNSRVGVGVSIPDAKLSIIETTEQFRSGYDATKWLSMTTDSNGDTYLTTSGSDQLIIKPTTNNGGMFKIVTTTDIPILIADSINQRIGLGTFSPARQLDIKDSSGDSQLRLTSNTGVYSDFLVTNEGDYQIMTQNRSIILPVNDNTDTFSVNSSSNINVFAVDTINNRVGINDSTPDATLHVQSITEQLRLGYDFNSYTKFTVDSSSNLLVEPSESGGFHIKTASYANAFSVKWNSVDVFNVNTDIHETTVKNTKASSGAKVFKIISDYDTQVHLGFETTYPSIKSGSIELRNNGDLRLSATTVVSTVPLTCINATDATDLVTGSFRLTGGASITKNLYVGGLTNIAGDLIVGGYTTLDQGEFNKLTVNTELVSNGSTYIGNNVNDELIVNATSTFNQVATFANTIEQIRLSYDIDSYASLTVDASSNLQLKPAESGYIRLRPTIDNTVFFNITNSSDVSIFNVDTTNERVEISTNDTTGDTLTIINKTSGNQHIKLQSSTGSPTYSYLRDNSGNLELSADTRVKSINIFQVTDTTETTDINTGSLIIDGGAAIKKNMYLEGTITIDNSTNSTDISTGSLHTSGGVGIAKDLYVGDDIFVTGNGSFASITVDDHAYLGSASSDELIVNATSTFNADVTINGDITAISPTIITMNSGGKIDLQAADGNRVVFNEDELNTDFRISGNGTNGDVTNLFYVDVNQQDNGGVIYDGCIGIGKLPGNYRLDVVGSVRSSGHFTSSSDRRLKKNITVIPNALDNLMKIKGVSFDWRKDEFPHKQFSSDSQIGVIAQDVEAVCPEIVSTDNEGFKTVAYDRLTAILIESVKEQQEQIKNLTNIIISLQQKFN